MSVRGEALERPSDVCKLQAGKKAAADGAVEPESPQLRMRTRKPMPTTVGLAKRLRPRPQGALQTRRRHAMERERAFQLVRRGRRGGRTTGRRVGLRAEAHRDHAPLLADVPVRLVASSFDTSVAIIERTYSAGIIDHGDAQMRRALFDVDAAAGGNVIPLGR